MTITELSFRADLWSVIVLEARSSITRLTLDPVLVLTTRETLSVSSVSIGSGSTRRTLVLTSDAYNAALPVLA